MSGRKDIELMLGREVGWSRTVNELYSTCGLHGVIQATFLRSSDLYRTQGNHYSFLCITIMHLKHTLNLKAYIAKRNIHDPQ